MKHCDVCKRFEKSSWTPAEYVQEWFKHGNALLVDVFVCEDHLILDIDKELLARGYTLQIKRIEP